jgi:large conductance mechanosensitive channel|tara:strand:- start:2953 stop:3363 length:411 start_codon:yes stop_codon:yes gene_type:complete
MKVIKEFKEFAIKGNMIEMAVGIVIGASFNSVVDVLVKNVLLPPLSLLSEGVNFQEKKITLRNGTSDLSEVSIDYGLLINTLVDFFIVGFTIFIIVKFFNTLKRKSEDVSESSIETPKNIVLLTQIRDSLEKMSKK